MTTIPVSSLVIAPEAHQKVAECLKSGCISGSSPYVVEFEKQWAQFVGAPYAVSVSNGTTALHLALAGLGIQRGDEVIVPNLTIISCALAPLYCGATPVLVDVENKTGTIDPIAVENAISSRTKAIIVVHLLGHPADMDPLLAVARKYNVAIVEDCAQAHGALYKNKMVGTFGDVAAFSFYANKIITTGEGGMLVTKHKWLYNKLYSLRNLAHSPSKRFYHTAIGFNYRMSGLQAALGIGQLTHIHTSIKQKRANARLYDSLFKTNPYLVLPNEASWAYSVYWMYALRITKDSGITKEFLMKQLEKLGIETRAFFYPLHTQPALKNKIRLGSSLKNSIILSRQGMYIPSGLTLTKQDIQYVAHSIHKLLPC